MSNRENFAELELLLENEYGRHYIGTDGKIVCDPNPDCLEYLTPSEAAAYCIELIEAIQILKYGRLL